jgi:hypothetical protein
MATNTPTAQQLIEMLRIPVDASEAVQPAAEAAESASTAYEDLDARRQRLETLTNPHYRAHLERSVDRAELLAAELEAPTPRELAVSRAARDEAQDALTRARAAERQRRLDLLQAYRIREVQSLSAEYARLSTKYAPLAQVEAAFAEVWPDLVPERFGGLVSPERLEAWRAAARTYDMPV